MDRLKGKVAIVTGGGGGIGGATARALAREGAAVLVVDINEAAADSVAGGIRDDGGSRRVVPRRPLRREQDVEAVIAEVTKRFGRLDVLHNNAALTDSDFLSADTAVTELSLEVWERTLAVNLRSQMLMCKHAVPIMVDAGRRLHHQHVLRRVAQGRPHPDRLRRLEGRGQRPHHVRGDEPREEGHPGQHDPAGPGHHRRRARAPEGGDAGRRSARRRSRRRWASPRTLPTSWCSWPRTSPATSPGRCSPSTAACPPMSGSATASEATRAVRVLRRAQEGPRT